MLLTSFLSLNIQETYAEKKIHFAPENFVDVIQSPELLYSNPIDYPEQKNPKDKKTKLHPPEIDFMTACKAGDTNSMRAHFQQEMHKNDQTSSLMRMIYSLRGYQDHIYQTNKFGESALHIAAYHGHLEAAELLLTNKADLNKKNNMGWTPLHVAASKGHVGVVKLLIEYGADIEKTTTKEGWSPLHIAHYNQHQEVIDLLLEKNEDKSGETYFQRIKRFFSSAYIDRTAKNRFSPLYTSAEIGDVGSVRYLLEKSADKKKTDSMGLNPLHIAAQNGHLEVVKLLALEEKSLFSNIFGTNHLYINQVDKNGFTPLYLAIKNGHTDIIEFLRSRGANLYQTNSSGESFLHLAAKHGHTDVINYLHQIGAADMTKANRHGETALYLAAKHEQIQCFEILRGLGSSLTSLTSEGETYLHLAAKKGDEKALEIFLNQGLIVDSRDKQENTPLHLAAKNNRVGATQALINRGADSLAKNKSKNTPLMLAVQKSSVNTAKILIKKDFKKLDDASRKVISSHKKLWDYYGSCFRAASLSPNN